MKDKQRNTKPILFSDPMVKAILEGRKSQTRRVMFQTNIPKFNDLYRLRELNDERAVFDLIGRVRTLKCGYITIPSFGIRYRYGKSSDRLWVRESFFDHGPLPVDGLNYQTPIDARIEYRATPWDRDDPLLAGEGWKPSIHMPRWASRITLEITSVRVERLQNISEADCVAEGVQVPITTEGCPPGKARILTQLTGPGPRGAFAPCNYLPKGDDSIEAYSRAHFASGWNALNAKRGYGWDTNPWVWVVEFKKL